MHEIKASLGPGLPLAPLGNFRSRFAGSGDGSAIPRSSAPADTCAAGPAAIVSQLLGVGAEWDLENSNGRTALDLAKSNDGKEASLDKGQGAAQALISHIAQAETEAEPEPGAD